MGDILRRTYRITRWAHWDDAIHDAVEDFRERFTLAPNILLASETTHARIDMAAKKKNIRGPDGEEAPEDEHTPIAAFRGEGYELDFCIDENVPTGRFSLICDAGTRAGYSNDVWAQRYRTDDTGAPVAAGEPLLLNPPDADGAHDAMALYGAGVVALPDDVWAVVWSEGDNPDFHVKARFLAFPQAR